MKFLKDKEIKNAFLIGVISSIAYLVCYVARNLLSVVSPQMIESAGVSVEYIGTLSTAQMLFYAGGQLVNGIIGDKMTLLLLTIVLIGFGALSCAAYLGDWFSTGIGVNKIVESGEAATLRKQLL